jgi:Ca2+-binding RTX toxin-like protein
MISTVEYAALAANIYNDQRGGAAPDRVNELGLPSGWRELEELGFEGDALSDNNPFSFTAGAYINDAGEIVVSYKGTDFLVEASERAWNTAADLAADVGLALAKGPIGLPQLLSASTYYLEVVRWASENGYDPNKISFTGHSLGGGLASAMAVWFDRPATTFAEAPFELSAIDPLFVLTAANALVAQVTGTGSLAVLEQINHLRDLLIPLEYQERQAAVTNYYVQGEFLTYLRAVLPTVVGSNLPIEIGDQPISRALSLHSMNLHLAFLLDDRLRQACIDIPELVPALIDPTLYFYDPNSTTKDLVTALVADQLTGDLSRQDGLLGKFTSEILKLQEDGGIAAQSKVRTALITVAMEYCYFNSEASAGSLFSVSNGGIHFKYSDIGADAYKSLLLLSDAVTATLSPQEKMLAGSLQRQNAWHVQSGDGSLNWSASASDAQNDAAIGGIGGDSIDTGLGNDVLIGGGGGDSLTGGKGSDILIGGDGNDKYYFSTGDGTDAILDSDGQGSIFFNGTKVEVGDRVAPNVWRSIDQTLMIERIPSSAGGGAFDLRIRNSTGDGTSILIRSWHAGNLGLSLNNTAIMPGLTATIDGSEDPDELRGEGANETIIGYESGDILSGGAGDDYLYADGVVDVETAILLGENGFSMPGYISLSGDADNDALSGGAGNDTLVGSGRGDLLSGGAGMDLLIGGRGDDFIVGDTDYHISAVDDDDNERFDWVFTQTLDDDGSGFVYRIEGGSSVLEPSDSGGDIIHAGGGDDVVLAGAGNDTVHGGDGDDRISAGSGSDTIIGGEGDDNLFGDRDWAGIDDPTKDGSDSIYGGRGNDYINGQGGDDFLFGGDDDDIVIGDRETLVPQDGGVDFVEGGEGNDALYGMGGADLLSGGAGIDLVIGGSGDDIVLGGSEDDVIRGDFAMGESQAALEAYHGNDFLDGGDGNDQVIGDGGNDTLIGGADDDELIGDSTFSTQGIEELQSRGNDYLDGGTGNDRLVGGALNDTLIGGIGNDTLVGDASYIDAEDHGDDDLDGGEGNDRLFAGGGSDTLRGGSGNDSLIGDGNESVASPDDDHAFDGNDYLEGGQGNDVLVGNGGNDRLYGGTDSDQLFGDSGIGDSATGNDYLDGGAGSDVLIGEGGADVLIGGAGDDTLAGEATYTLEVLHGNDYLDGGAGNDLLLGEGGADKLYGGEGDDRLYGESSTTPITVEGDDFLDGGNGDDILAGAGGNDVLYGGQDDDLLGGGTGNDTLIGEEGLDVLLGDAGNDVLDGGIGRDVLNGGDGNDVYRFGIGSGYDEICDGSGVDRIELAAGILPEHIRLIRSSTFAATNTAAYGDGDSLILVLNGNDQLLISNTYAPGNTGAVEEIRFADGTIWNSAEIAAHVIDQSGQENHYTTIGMEGVFMVDHPLDTIEAIDDGTVQGASSFVTFSLPENIENLTLAGELATNAIGNSLDNVLTGNSAANVFIGNGGMDTLIGGLGDDSYYVDGSDYRIDEFGNFIYASAVIVEQANEGYDTLFAYDLRDVGLADNVEKLVLKNFSYFSAVDSFSYRGNSLDNIIDVSGPWFNQFDYVYVDGGAGADTLIGSTGGQVYAVDSLSDVVVELDVGSNSAEGASGRDEVQSSVDYVLSSLIEDLTLVGSDAITGKGNAFGNRIYGRFNVAANTLIGGFGNDTYVVGANDVVVENAGEGVDTVEADSTYSLGSNIENLLLSSDGDGYGNSDNNKLDATNYSTNTLFGGLGDDTYLINGDSLYTEADVVVENADEGTDTVVVKSLFSNYGMAYTLGDNIENGTIASAGVLYGNDLDNILTAQTSSPALIFGKDGNDVFIDTSANLSLVGGRGADTYRFSAGFGSDSIGDTESGDTQDSAIDVVEFDATINRSDVVFGKSSDRLSLLVSVVGRSDELTILNFFQSGAFQDRIELFRFSDGSTITAEEIQQSFGIYGTNGDDILVAPVGGEELYGLGGSDTLFGDVGNDLLDGGSGADTMTGGAGGDLYRIDDAGDVVAENADEGEDTVESAISYTLLENFENLTLIGSSDVDGLGNDGINVLRGNSGNNILDGGGSDDSLYGGAGNDTYYIDSFDSVHEYAAEGVDTLYAKADFGSEGVVAFLRLEDNIENAVLLGTYDALVFGTAGDNLLIGNSGANQLIGFEGADTMIGGLGDDYYDVFETGDVVVEAAGEGFDTVAAGISYTLGDNVEVLTLGYDSLNAITGTGNQLNNELYGNPLDNIIDGGLGADHMEGDEGNDTYVVDNVGDTIVEYAGFGTDTVRSSVSWTLGADVENLTLIGNAASGTGNSLANQITGNAANNTLSGGGGNDTLDGGAGNDSMSGGSGNDTYIVGSTLDTVTESSGQGTDTVRSSVTWTLGTNVENLVLTGNSDINGIGNSATNSITGNAGNNLLDGGSGADTLIGGAGNDTYMVDSSSDVVTEVANEGIDLVQSTATYTIGNNLENLTLSGTNTINGTGNALDNVLMGNGVNNTLTGGAGNDTLNGGGGSDIMVGGSGNDTYTVDVTGDVVTEAAGEGTDLVRSSASYTIGSNVENLTLTGTNTINGTGNTLDNILIGNDVNNTLTGGAGNDTLIGGLGTDTMIGGAGNDTYDVNVSTDVTTENAGEGIDLVNSSVTRTLAGNIEMLFLTGTGANNATGNTLGNLLRGNTSNNALVGGGGLDVLEGGGGNDILSNTSGNTLLNGGAGTDTLTGASNNDLLIGGIGNDALTTGSGADIIAFNKGDGLDTVVASTAKDNTLSIGGGSQYADLLFQKSGNDLILKVGASDQITLTGYYASTSNRSVNKLQVVLEGSADYNAGSSNAMYNKKIETFNFDGLVSAFDAARAANPSLTTWALSGSLAAQYLSGSDTAAMGGDLAYRYGRFGNLSDVSFTPAAGILGASTFGTSAQTLQAVGSLQGGTQRLS